MRKYDFSIFSLRVQGQCDPRASHIAHLAYAVVAQRAIGADVHLTPAADFDPSATLTKKN